MPGGRVHPDARNAGSSSDYIENDSGCSLRTCLRTRSRRICFVLTIVSIILMCGLIIPLSVILSACNKENTTVQTSTTISSKPSATEPKTTADPQGSLSSITDTTTITTENEEITEMSDPISEEVTNLTTTSTT